MGVDFFWGAASSIEESNRSRMSKRTKYICQTGAFAALYIVLTCASALFPLAAGIQLRPAEALCTLAYYTPTVVPGMTIGCLLANLITGAPWQDVVFGTIATLIGACIGRAVRHSGKWMIALPTVISNVVILPPVISLAYGTERGFFFVFALVAVSEILNAYVLGMIVLLSLKRVGRKIFRI